MRSVNSSASSGDSTAPLAEFSHQTPFGIFPRHFPGATNLFIEIIEEIPDRLQGRRANDIVFQAPSAT